VDDDTCGEEGQGSMDGDTSGGGGGGLDVDGENTCLGRRGGWRWSDVDASPKTCGGEEAGSMDGVVDSCGGEGPCGGVEGVNRSIDDPYGVGS
jgi:hypothetical protein